MSTEMTNTIELSKRITFRVITKKKSRTFATIKAAMKHALERSLLTGSAVVTMTPTPLDAQAGVFRTVAIISNGKASFINYDVVKGFSEWGQF